MSNSENPDKETLERWHKDPCNWKFGVFYYNPEDKRLLPPKRIAWMGWTINFANKKSVLLFIGVFAFFTFVAYLITSKK